jgi:hypothetical protein
LDTLRLVSLAWHMVIYYEVTQHLCVHAVICPVPFHTNFRRPTYHLQCKFFSNLGDNRGNESNVVVTSGEVCLSSFLSAPAWTVLLFLFTGLYATHLFEVS